MNRFLLSLSLGGLGVLNYRSPTESGELSFLRRYLPDKNGVLIDVGANKGNYSMQAAKINKSLPIYAFEPHPKTFSLLSGNLKNFREITILNSGVSDVSGRLKLYDYLDSDGSEHASLFKEVITNIHGSKSVTSHNVELTTIDSFVLEHSIDEICLLKIDTEGNELAVLKGAKNTLKSGIIKAIHFEFNEMNIVSRVFFKDFEDALRGYRIYRLLPNDMLEISRYNPLQCEIFAYQNIVAILKDQ